MNELLPDSVQNALNTLSEACANNNLKLDNVVISRRKMKPGEVTYLLMTPGGVVSVKQKL